MSQPPDQINQPLVTTGTRSWERAGVEAEHEVLAEFLEEVAGSDTIKSAMSLAVARMRLRAGSAVLDVGCGTGVIFAEIGNAIGPAGKIMGIDHASSFLADARRRADDSGYGTFTELLQGDAHTLPFSDNAFDAGHTERVLMHLSDPDLALRELHRVVRPGGWVVCVEPDLTGMRIDLPAADAAANIVAGFSASIRNPSMGLELNRRMAAAGLINRKIDVLTEVEREYEPDTAAFFRRAADTAIERGWLTASEASQTLAEMQRAGDLGIYTSYSSMFVVTGQVPD
jgi:SAM-dependent methyltransferase